MADRFSLDDIKDLFRDDVTRFIEGMRAQLARLLSNPCDAAAAEQLCGFGHALKGSAGLVGLTHLSQAGDAIDRVGHAAQSFAQSDPRAALAIFRNAQSALPVLERIAA